MEQLEVETKQVVVREVPVDLWRQLKIRAATDGTTLQATLAKAIEHFLRQSA